MFLKQRQFVVCLAVGALLCSAGSATAQLLNGDFETGDLTNWTDPSNVIGVANATIDAPSVGAESGDFAARLALAVGVSELTQTFPAAPGEEFNLSGYMLAASEDPEIAGNSFQLLKIVFEDESGTDLEPASVSVGQFSAPEFPGVDSLPFIDSTSPQDTWIFSEAQGVAPAGTVSVTFFVLNVDFGDDGIEYPKWADSLNANNVADGVNLLENGDFETGDFTGWVPEFNPNVDNANVGEPGVGAQDGDFAAELALASGVSELRQTFPAAPGDEFCLEGFMLTENALPFGATFGLYKIVFQDAAGNDLQIDGSLISAGQEAPSDVPGVESLPFLDFSSTPNTWILSSAQGVAPPETVQVVFLALNVDFADGLQNAMWFDNMKAANVADGVNLLENPNFETGDFTGWAPAPPSGGEATVGAPTVGAQAGDFAGLLTPQDGVGELLQSFPASPGQEYNMNGYMLSEAAIPDGPSFGLYKIVFRDASGMDLEPESVSVGQFAPPDVPGVESLPFLNSSSDVNVWQFSEAQGVAPAETVEVLFFALNIDFAGGLNPIWFDSIEADLVGGKMKMCDFPLGDVNQDGDPNLLDVVLFVNLITDGGESCEADVNEDGSIDLLDVAPFVAILTGG